MKNNIHTRLGAGITALALSLTLTSGCEYKKRDKFYFSCNIKGETYIHKNDYISSEYINNYYLIELYHRGLERNMIYIAYGFKYTNGMVKYTNIFNNNTIAYNPDNEDYYDFISVTPLIDILEQYNIVKEKYTYEDMKYIYKIIKENYNSKECKIKKKIKES